MCDGNARRGLFEEFEEVDVLFDISDDIAELVIQGYLTFAFPYTL